MKQLTLILFLIPALCAGQGKYVLLERGWHRPASYVDSITNDHIRTGYFPIYAAQLIPIQHLNFTGRETKA